MARKARNELKGNYFHVLVEGVSGEQIFEDDFLKDMYLRSLADSKKFYPIKIIAYCVMDTHAHILVAVRSSIDMANYFKRVNSDYAIRYNKHKCRVGYVFRDRFKSESIISSCQVPLYAACIHREPIKAGVSDALDDYAFSSYKDFFGGMGVVDLRQAVRHLGKAERIRQQAEELASLKIIDRDDREYEDKNTVLKELKKKYNIINNYSIRNVKTCRMLATELRMRSGTSIRQMADMIGIGRETLRKWLHKEGAEKSVIKQYNRE